MKRKNILPGFLLSAAVLLSAPAAFAAPVYWTDWTGTTAEPSGVLGTLNIDSSTVSVTFLGAYFFAQASGGTNYWNPPAPYISSTVDNAPPASDIIALNPGGTAAITFSAAVQDPLIALVSWNDNTVDFGVPIDILSSGLGHFGQGTLIPNSTGTGFSGMGEVHGVIRLPGRFTSITFTHTEEFWHGFTVGATGLANLPNGTPDPPNGDPQPPSGVPEPAGMLLLAFGLVGLAGVKRLKK